LSDRTVETTISAVKEDLRAFGKSSVADMADAAQRARMLAGFTERPDVDMMQYVVRLDDLSNFLDAVQTRPHEVARRLNSMGRK
jgi:uncharacterized protein HemX